MPLTPSYYELLNVEYCAEPDTIRKAYHALARHFHPDIHPGPESEEIIRTANCAYETLMDPNKRAQYDMMLLLERRDCSLWPQASNSQSSAVISHSLPDYSENIQKFAIKGFALIAALFILFFAYEQRQEFLYTASFNEKPAALKPVDASLKMQAIWTMSSDGNMEVFEKIRMQYLPSLRVFDKVSENFQSQDPSSLNTSFFAAHKKEINDTLYASETLEKICIANSKNRLNNDKSYYRWLKLAQYYHLQQYRAKNDLKLCDVYLPDSTKIHLHALDIILTNKQLLLLDSSK